MLLTLARSGAIDALTIDREMTDTIGLDTRPERGAETAGARFETSGQGKCGNARSGARSRLTMDKGLTETIGLDTRPVEIVRGCDTGTKERIGVAPGSAERGPHSVHAYDLIFREAVHAIIVRVIHTVY
jgi:hypothetical protein